MFFCIDDELLHFSIPETFRMANVDHKLVQTPRVIRIERCENISHRFVINKRAKASPVQNTPLWNGIPIWKLWNWIRIRFCLRGMIPLSHRVLSQLFQSIVFDVLCFAKSLQVREMSVEFVLPPKNLAGQERWLEELRETSDKFWRETSLHTSQPHGDWLKTNPWAF